MNETLNINDQYQVATKSILNSYDRKILSALYQPIIGHKALALYFSLWSEIEIDRVYSTKARISRLLKIMVIDLNNLMESFNMLEALGLIDSYYKNNQDYAEYHITLYSPKSPEYFFNNPILVDLLIKTLGQQEFMKTQLFFKTSEPDLKDFKCISKKYREVFNVSSLENHIDDTSKFKTYQYASINEQIDLDFIKEYLTKFNLSSLATNKKIIKHLELALVSYNLSTIEVLDILIACVNDNNVNLDLFLNQIKLSSEVNKYQSKLELVHLADTNATNIYESNSVVSFLKTYFPAYKVDIDMLVILEDIIKTYQLNTGTFNVLIEYALKNSNNININYIKAIAKSWQNDNITTVNQALDKLKRITKAKPKYQYNNTKTVIGKDAMWYENNKTKDNDEEIEDAKNLLERMSNNGES